MKMGILETALVRKLLTTNPQHKRDIMEDRIRALLDASPMMHVTCLPPRRGPADGGIDGIANVSRFIDGEWINTRAALNIKVRNSAFSREQLGGFLLDIDREQINIGLIITASGLSPDANSEMIRKNAQGQIILRHIFLEDLLSGQPKIDGLIFSNQNISEMLKVNLQTVLERG
jgi:hypothetical protein